MDFPDLWQVSKQSASLVWSRVFGCVSFGNQRDAKITLLYSSNCNMGIWVSEDWRTRFLNRDWTEKRSFGRFLLYKTWVPQCVLFTKPISCHWICQRLKSRSQLKIPYHIRKVLSTVSSHNGEGIYLVHLLSSQPKK